MLNVRNTQKLKISTNDICEKNWSNTFTPSLGRAPRMQPCPARSHICRARAVPGDASAHASSSSKPSPKRIAGCSDYSLWATAQFNNRSFRYRFHRDSRYKTPIFTKVLHMNFTTFKPDAAANRGGSGQPRRSAPSLEPSNQHAPPPSDKASTLSSAPADKEIRSVRFMKPIGANAHGPGWCDTLQPLRRTPFSTIELPWRPPHARKL